MRGAPGTESWRSAGRNQRSTVDVRAWLQCRWSGHPRRRRCAAAIGVKLQRARGSRPSLCCPGAPRLRSTRLHMQNASLHLGHASPASGEQEARIGPDAPGGRALLPSADLERSDEGNGDDLTIVGGQRSRSVKHGHVGPRSHSRFGGRGAEHRLGDNSHPSARRPPRRRFDRPGSARRTDGSATDGHRSRGTPVLA